MGDMPIFAFILLGIMLFAFAAISFLFFLIDHRDRLYTFDDDAIMNSDSFECVFRRVGGAKYEHTSLKLSFLKNDKAKLEYSSKPSEGARTVEQEFDVPAELAMRLREMYKEHCIPVLSDCEKREDINGDIPVSSVTFSAKEQSYTIDSEQILPENSKTLISDIEQMLMSYVK
ncbi:MAG: hypothetical protein IJU51_03260 [Clostridia bacterium]|nr:hypothetical protein [Clostridia bacterium]